MQLENVVVFSERATIRPLYLLNGAGVLVAVALIIDAPVLTASLVTPIKFWIGGLILATGTTIANHFYRMLTFGPGRSADDDSDGESAARRRGAWIRRLAYAFGLASLVCFGIGSWQGADALMPTADVPPAAETGPAQTYEGAGERYPRKYEP